MVSLKDNDLGKDYDFYKEKTLSVLLRVQEHTAAIIITSLSLKIFSVTY